MGVLYDYFAADSDEHAATAVDLPGGPGGAAVQAPARRGGLFRRRQEPVEPPSAAETGFDVVSVKGIEPVVQLGTLEELLTGRPYDDIVADPRSGEAVAVRHGGELLVLTLSDTLVAALATATDSRLAEVAVPWSRTEEFWGEGDPDELTDFLRDLSALARRAQERGQRLYCWVCV